MRPMYAPRPRKCGETNPRAKLTEKEVLEIRTHTSGRPGYLSRLAEKYDVNINTIRAVLSRQSWKHI